MRIELLLGSFEVTSQLTFHVLEVFLGRSSNSGSAHLCLFKV
jgi:hypothetical protein